jgi:hypothetical protein
MVHEVLQEDSSERKVGNEIEKFEPYFSPVRVVIHNSLNTAREYLREHEVKQVGGDEHQHNTCVSRYFRVREECRHSHGHGNTIQAEQNEAS